MRFYSNWALTATLSLFIWFLSDVSATRHRHQHQNDVSSSLDKSTSSSSREMAHGKTRTKQRRAEDQVGNFNAMLPNTSPNKAPDLMRDYLSRNMYQCSSKYMGTLTKLHVLIKVRRDVFVCYTVGAEKYPMSFGIR
jgi:hypothetical protein